MFEVSALAILVILFIHRTITDPKRLARIADEQRKAAQNRAALAAIQHRIDKRRAILAKLAAEEAQIKRGTADTA